MALSLAGALGAAILLGIAYRWMAERLTVAPWVAAGLVHTGLAVGLVVFDERSRWALTGASRGTVPAARPSLRLAYLPALVMLCGATGLALTSRLAIGGFRTDATNFPWLTTTWIPLVEELVFRGGLGQRFVRNLGPLWGSWMSAIAFSLVHSDLSLAAVRQGQIGLPLGPFLLGLASQALLAWSGRLMPAVALHAACNATPYIFSLVDARWLSWLSELYLT